MKLFFVLLPAFILHGFLYSQTPVIDSWEPGEGQIDSSLSPPALPPPHYSDFFVNISVDAISFYQQDISPRSISRCPFTISCSRFAKTAFKKHGMAGLLYIMDRYFYRENGEAFLYYPLTVISENILKLDDSYYLYH